MYLLTICMSSLKKCLFRSFAHFKLCVCMFVCVCACGFFVCGFQAWVGFFICFLDFLICIVAIELYEFLGI